MDKLMFSQYYLGVRISQNDKAIPLFDEMFKLLEINLTPVSRIIELGTYHGGLSVFLGLYCFMNNIKFITYDLEPFVNNIEKVKNIFETLKIDYRVKNINEYKDEIITEIKKEGMTLLLCDGGDKINEFNTFSQHIKINDIIMAHDYAKDLNFFNDHIKNKLWNWHEIQHSQIEKACVDNGLVDFMSDEFENAVWVCKRKEK